MNLIIGGAYQGKCDYAMERYGLRKEEIVDGNTCSLKELFGAKAIRDFHLFLRRQMEEKRDLSCLAADLTEHNPDLIVITDEVGYGIVPMDPADRAWREACGRVCTVLAAGSREVIRVNCGIGQVLKG